MLRAALRARRSRRSTLRWPGGGRITPARSARRRSEPDCSGARSKPGRQHPRRTRTPRRSQASIPHLRRLPPNGQLRRVSAVAQVLDNNPAQAVSMQAVSSCTAQIMKESRQADTYGCSPALSTSQCPGWNVSRKGFSCVYDDERHAWHFMFIATAWAAV